MHRLRVVFVAAGLTACSAWQRVPGKDDEGSDAPSPPVDEQPDDAKSEGDEGDEGDAPQFHLTVKADVASIQKNLLDPYCVRCHSGPTPRAKLDLTDLAGWLSVHPAGMDHDGYHGPLVVAGRPHESMLVLIMKTTNAKQRMPPPDSGIPSVDAAQIAAVSQWISSLPAAPADDDEPGDDGLDDDEPGGAPNDDEPGT